MVPRSNEEDLFVLKLNELLAAYRPDAKDQVLLLEAVCRRTELLNSGKELIPSPSSPWSSLV